MLLIDLAQARESFIVSKMLPAFLKLCIAEE
jgi:hypothetical protein